MCDVSVPCSTSAGSQTHDKHYLSSCGGKDSELKKSVPSGGGQPMWYHYLSAPALRSALSALTLL